MSLVEIGNVDITPYINKQTYSVNAEETYESWLDGNYREHRIYTISKVKGSFEIALFGQNNMDTAAFLTLWNSVVENHIATVKVFVQNTNTLTEITAYFDFKGTFHREMINGNYCDRLTINITER